MIARANSYISGKIRDSASNAMISSEVADTEIAELYSGQIVLVETSIPAPHNIYATVVC